MGFPYLTDDYPSSLAAKIGSDESVPIPIIAIGEEIAFAVRTHRNPSYGRMPRFKEWVLGFAEIRERIAHQVNSGFNKTVKRTVVTVAFLENVALNEADEAFASEHRVVAFTEKDLEYYETLTAHLGPAAQYQLLADVLPGKAIPGLEIRVPAVRIRIGSNVCYTFSITPEYLLKIAYVSHRTKGKASDVHTYQRMVSKSRLNRIRDYIDNDGIFPTNIVVNLDSKRLQFHRAKQEGDEEGGTLGWLDIRPSYKAAWIIDGQHRLFAYSGNSHSHESRLAVLAFEGLPPSKQAAMFIDINAKQKSVKQSLLQELYAELHWDAADPQLRVRAIISKAIQELDNDPESPLRNRIQAADLVRDETRCVTLPALFGALERGEFFIAKERRGGVVQFGPLWAGGSTSSLRRTTVLLKSWLSGIREGAAEWWDKGAGNGGGLAMSDGIVSCIAVLKNILQHLERDPAVRLIDLSNSQIVEAVAPYAEELGKYFGRLSNQERKAFRDLRGNQGIATRLRRAQLALRDVFPEFSPMGLDDFVEAEKAQTNVRAKAVVDRIETTLQKSVVDELVRDCGADEWWVLGIPRKIRKKATDAFEEDDHRRGSPERYFDLIDYREIAQSQWKIFEPLLAFGSGSKDKRTSWLVFVNEQRRLVAHASSGTSVTMENLMQLEEYERELMRRLAAEPSADVVR
jgi:DGQHR domain-containing protein